MLYASSTRGLDTDVAASIAQTLKPQPETRKPKVP